MSRRELPVLRAPEVGQEAAANSVPRELEDQGARVLHGVSSRGVLAPI